MTKEGYDELFKAAARLIEQEWTCTASQRDLLALINKLSFGQGHSWARVPHLADFAEILGFHKSTVSRAIHKACELRYLMVMKHAGETLYSLVVRTRGTAQPAGSSPAEQREAALKRLIELQHTCLQGRADPDGQVRLPGIFDSEELDAPAAAFEAMMEAAGGAAATGDFEPATPAAASRRPVSPSTPAAVDPDAMDAAQFRRHLEGLVATAPAGPAAAAPGVARRATDAELDQVFDKLVDGLKSDARYAMEALREEVKTAGRAHEQHVFGQWGRRWRETARKHPLQLACSAGAHKAKRQQRDGKRANEPGAWIFTDLETTLKAGKAAHSS